MAAAVVAAEDVEAAAEDTMVVIRTMGMVAGAVVEVTAGKLGHSDGYLCPALASFILPPSHDTFHILCIIRVQR